MPRKSEWFLAPVDHVALQLIDYTRIIKRPMDLGTVRKNLESGQYQVLIGVCCVGGGRSCRVMLRLFTHVFEFLACVGGTSAALLRLMMAVVCVSCRVHDRKQFTDARGKKPAD